jgi:hypothetical protein
MQVLLTDAPGDYESVLIDIREVRVHLRSDAEESENGWRTIRDEPLQVDLLELTNGEMEFLGEAELEPGLYRQMRLVLGDQNEVVVNGETHALKTPGGQQSGLKINLNAEIESGQTLPVLIDFDASRSVVRAGASGNYLLKPVLRAVNLNETGAIGGEIEPAGAMPWIYAIAGEDTLAGTRASEGGDFLMIGIPPGAYQVSVVPNGNQYSTTIISNIGVTMPDTTFLGAINLQGAE